MAALACGGTLRAAEPPGVAFLDQYCTGCHNPADLKGRLDLESLAYDPENRANFALWAKVHDRVQAGEMPPKEKRRPDAARLGPFLQTLATTLTETEQAITARDGRSVQRRLNRYEYENTLRDLLGVPWARVMDMLPQDGEAFRYNKSGEALDVSHVQMARYLGAADYAMRQAMRQELDRPAPATRRFHARDEPSLRNFMPRENGTLPDRLTFPVLDSRAQPEVRAGRAPFTSPETREREAVGKVSSTFSDAGGYSWGQFRAPIAGRYRLRFSGYSIWVSGGGIGRWFFEGQGEQKSPVYWLPVWHRPNLDEVWPGRRPEPIGVYAAAGQGQRRQVGAFDFTPEPAVHGLEVLLAAGEVIQTDGSRLFRTRVNGTDEQYVNPLAQPDGMPGYAVQWMEVEGPLADESTGAGYRLLFDDLPLRRLEPGAHGVMLETVPPPPPPLWSGSVGAGLAVTSGNADTSTFNLAFKLTYDPMNPHLVTADALHLRATSEGNSTVDRSTFNVRDEYTWTARVSFFGQVRYLRDTFKTIDYLVAPTGGVLYKLVNLEPTKFTIDAGGGVVWESNTGLGTNTSGAVTLGENFSHKFTPTTTFTQSASGLWKTSDFGDSLYTIGISLAAAVTQRVQLKVELLELYKSQPPIGIEKGDVSFITSVVYSF